jgi:hypothetical protein
MRSLVHAMHIVRQLQLELDQVIFEIDSSIVTAVVLTRATSISYLKHLLEGVINLLKLPDWSASVQHCFHEFNLYADTLAKQDRDAPFFFSFPIAIFLMSSFYWTIWVILFPI